MPTQVGQTCYDTTTDAAEAQASSLVGGFLTVGTVPHTVSLAGVDETSITYILTPVNGGAPITHVAPFTPQPCHMLTAADGLSIGWMIGAAWIGAFCILSIRHALSGETGGSYGNA